MKRLKTPRHRRVIEPGRFAAQALGLPADPSRRSRRVPLAIAGLIVSGIALGATWRQAPAQPAPQEEIFVLEEPIRIQAELPAPTPPPTPAPVPPPPEPEPPAEEPPPPPRLGLEASDAAASGDLAVAAGNTLNQEAEPETAPPADPPVVPPASVAPTSAHSAPGPLFIDQPPRVVQGEPPEYPANALLNGAEGTVVALISIDTSGRVTQVSVEKSAGSEFDQCVLEAARATIFQAPIRQGRKVPARFRRPFEFRLEG